DPVAVGRFARREGRAPLPDRRRPFVEGAFHLTPERGAPLVEQRDDASPGAGLAIIAIERFAHRLNGDRGEPPERAHGQWRERRWSTVLRVQHRGKRAAGGVLSDLP